MRKLSIIAALFFVLGCAGSVCVAQSNPQPAQSAEQGNYATIPNQPTGDSRPELHKRNPRYRIEADDIMELSFRYTPEFDQEVTVQPDGFIQLKGLPDEVHVQGLTVPELIVELKKDYGNVLNDPVISVVLRDFEKPYFIADGQVGKPGKYDLRGDVTLSEAVAMAGGFTDMSKHSQVLLFRRAQAGWYKAEIFNLKKMEKAGDLKEDPTLRAGDMLFVPKNSFSKFRAFIPGSSMGAFVPLAVP